MDYKDATSSVKTISMYFCINYNCIWVRKRFDLVLQRSDQNYIACNYAQNNRCKYCKVIVRSTCVLHANNSDICPVYKNKQNRKSQG